MCKVYTLKLLYIRTFVSDGVQHGRIKNFSGNLVLNISVGGGGMTSFFYYSSGPFVQGAIIKGEYGNSYSQALYNFPSCFFDPSCVVPTGLDVAPANFSERWWCRVA
jgi:hypothetical protein